ncbi:WD40 repeat domain-containing protein [Elioraea sp.]|uniref:WD40 repeat domain-containing protein n=1 Tax=Elioraea sp. TaxID=2185103 RepID=UPI0025C100B6|nr:WD40 repeat domain-containing protein [Elioraea sp.]
MTAETAGADFILETRGSSHALEAHVVAAAIDGAGRHVAFGLGDGTVALIGLADPARVASRVAVHDGAVLALAPDCAAGAFLSGGDDGRFARVDAAGDATTIASWPGRWVEHVLAFPGKSPWRAASVGKATHLFDGGTDASTLKTLSHPSTVTGIATDAKGKRIAASHYNGASVWFVAAKEDRPRAFAWKGSHTGIAMSPDGRYLVTSMQENSLHGWRLEDGADMRMSGYPAKTKSMSFTAKARWLATSGAEAVVCWPFSGDGPMGKAPRELAGGDAVLVSQVACHPHHEVVAAGFADGLVVLVEIESGRVLPVADQGRGAVSALAWSPDGRWLTFGTETGFAAVVDFSSPSR